MNDDAERQTNSRINGMIEELKGASSFASDASISARDAGWTKTAIKLDACRHILTAWAKEWERMLDDQNDR